MERQEVWTVIRVTHRGGLAHVEMGSINERATGPLIKVPLADAPRVGENIRLTYSWGEDYTAPVTQLRETD